MGVVIALGTYLGYRADLETGMSFPLFLLIGCFLSLAIAFYQLFKSLKSDDS
ncbi:AtpZ/AtpI family protein [Cyclobacterium xiamenense]|uniref:AtpZ/AtpI family protein n=1 Tax=Cyclobacterium xiamenense TaxID=1297121 RepID=UPI0035CFF454